MKNSIEIWLLQIGEQCINTEINKEQCINNEIFAEFNRILLRTLQKNAPLEKKLVSNIKETTWGKPWVTKK